MLRYAQQDQHELVTRFIGLFTGILTSEGQETLTPEAEEQVREWAAGGLQARLEAAEADWNAHHAAIGARLDEIDKTRAALVEADPIQAGVRRDLGEEQRA